MQPKIPDHYFNTAEWIPLDGDEVEPEDRRVELAKHLLEDLTVPMLETKETHIREAKSNHEVDVPPAVGVVRGGRVAAFAVCSRQDVDEICAFIRSSVVYFEADAVLVGADIHWATSWVNPLTGEPWRPHEMQKLARSPECPPGELIEAIHVERFDRSGKSARVSFPYRLIEPKWHRPTSNGCGNHRTNRKKRQGRRTLRPGSIIWSGTAHYHLSDTYNSVMVGGEVAQVAAESFSLPNEVAQMRKKAQSSVGCSDEVAQACHDLTIRDLLAELHPRWEILLPPPEAMVLGMAPTRA